MSRRRSSIAQPDKKVFLLSGFDAEERKTLSKTINQLGGSVLDCQEFRTTSSHIILGKLSRSEKYLGACATGKWALHPSYVHDSLTAGVFLDEEQYEWCADRVINGPGVDEELAYASRRWRFLLGAEIGAFSGWRVAVVTGPKRAKVIKRLLHSGGAELYNITFPLRNPEKMANYIGYCIVSENSVAAVSKLFEHGVLCLRPEYVGDFLIKDPQPDIMDYLVQLGPTTPNDSQQTNDNSFLAESQTSITETSSSSTQHTPNGPRATSGISDSPQGLSILTHHTGPSATITPRTVNQSRLGSPSSLLDSPHNIAPWSQSDQLTHQAASFLTKQTTQNLTDRSCSTQTRLHSESTRTWTVTSSTAIDSSTSSPAAPTEISTPPSPVSSMPSSQLKGSDWSSPTSCKSSYKLDKSVSVNLKKLIMQSPLKNQLSAIPRSSGDYATVEQVNENNLTNKMLENNVVTGSRKSMRQELTDKSPAWKSLIPKRRPSKETCTGEPPHGINEESSKELVKKDVQNDLATKESSENVPTPNKPTRTESKPYRLLQESAAKMSRITSFFKPVINQNNPLTNITKDSGHTTGNKALTDFVQEKKPIIEKCDAAKLRLILASASQRLKRTVALRNIEKKIDITCTQENLSCRSNCESSEVAETDDSSNESNKENSSEILKSTTTKGSKTIKQDENNVEMDTQEVPVEVNIRNDRPYENNLMSKQDNGNDRVETRASRKRKFSRGLTPEKSMTEIEDDFEPGRKRMLSSDWRPTSFIGHLCSAQKTDSVPLRGTTSDIIHIMIEDQFYETGLQELFNSITTLRHPRADTLALVISTLLKDISSDIEMSLSQCALMKSLSLHPPVTAQLQVLYLKSLTMTTPVNIFQQGQQWDFIKDIIYGSISDDELYCRKTTILFKYVTRMLMYNLSYFQHQVPGDARSSHMLIHILWSSGHIAFNAKVRELFDAVSSIVALLAIQKERQSHLLDILSDVLWLVAMVFETARLHEKVSGLVALESECLQTFVIELEKRIHGQNTEEIVQFILSQLQLPWLQVALSRHLMLETFQDTLVADRQEQELDITTVVNYFMFLVPRLCRSETPLRRKSMESPKHQKTTRAEAAAATKRNHKGETPLMVACIKNDLAAVRKLLQIPGVDVNMSDNAGWTALHEAANHGHVQCVRELLTFPNTIQGAFNRGTSKKLDLLACNTEGITPLHDAVLNNRVECCHLLLKHGGPRLLEARTCLNYTPLDLAESQEMVDLLSSFVTTRRHLSESQGSFSPSQGSSQSSEESLGECPADDHYDQLLHVDGHRLYTDTDQLHIYIHLVFTLTYKYMLTDPTLKNILQANRSFESKSMCQKCASLATKDELSIQNEFTSGTVTCNQSDVTDSKLTGLKNSSKTIQCSECQRKHLKLVLKQTGYHEMCSGETNRCVRREVGVVLNIDRYIESFEKHLLKICKPGSEDSIKEKLKLFAVI